jgi:hypothetical protein
MLNKDKYLKEVKEEVVMSLLNHYKSFFLIFIFFFLPGCLAAITAPFESSSPQNRDEESFAEFMDVPYPSIFSLDKKNSFTYSRRNVLSGVVTVAGRLNLDEIGAYYDQHLPQHGWVPVAEAQGSKLVSTWKKGEAILTILAQPATFSIGNDTRVELWVSPPHLKGDLGQRVIYQSTKPNESFSTTPSRPGKNSGVLEEDL